MFYTNLFTMAHEPVSCNAISQSQINVMYSCRVYGLIIEI